MRRRSFVAWAAGLTALIVVVVIGVLVLHGGGSTPRGGSASGTTTSVPGGSTSVPGGSTSVPAGATSVPTSSTSAPGVSTTLPAVPSNCALPTTGPSQSVVSFGATGDGVHDDSSAFQRAIAAAAADHGYVLVPAPKVAFKISHTVKLASGVVVTGGAARPDITGGVAKGYLFRLSDLTGGGLACLTLDLGHLGDASAVNVRASTNVTLTGLTIMNVTRGWGINIGTTAADTTTISNTGIALSDSSFSGFDSPFEQVLVYNSAQVTITKCHFGSATYHKSGGGLGLYQNDNQVMVSGNTFGPGLDSTASYYSVTVNNVTYQQNTFIGNKSSAQGNRGIQGANSSDHGLFGQTTAQNYTITGNTFMDYRLAVQVGAVSNAHVTGNTFETNDVAVMVNDGNLYYPTNVSVPDNGLTISANSFQNNGGSAPVGPGLAAASILFMGQGGHISATITGNHFVVAGTSTPVLNFDGRSTWDGLSISKNTVTAPASQFIVKSNGAAFGPNVANTDN